jgi:transposase
MKRCKRTNHTTTPALCPTVSDQISPHESGGHGAYQSRAEIAARSASAATAAERRRWQVIGLLADGTPLAEIVAATGYRPRTIRQIAQRYRDSGPAGLVDGRQRSLGATPLLSLEQQDELRAALQGVPPDGGRWNGPKVARWIAARTGKHVHRQRGWEYLRRFGGNAEPADGG